MYDRIWDGLVAFFFLSIAAAIGLGMVLAWGLPKLWQLLKPWLHSVTG